MSELLDGEFTLEIFEGLTRGSYWATNLSGIEVFDPWEGEGGGVLPFGAYNTFCIRDLVDSSESKNSKKANADNFVTEESNFKKNEIQSRIQNFNANKTEKEGRVQYKSQLKQQMKHLTYQKIQESSDEVIGCGFFKVGCSDKSLGFPDFRPDFHIKDYRRIYL